MKKNLRIKLTENCTGDRWSVGLYEGKKPYRRGSYKRKYHAIKWAKVIAKLINIKYDPEIIKEHGC